MSSDWKEVERRIASVTKSERRPVAVTFLDGEPADIEKFEGSEPSSCSFWRLAAKGRTFYTLPESHFNCALGAYTQNIPLSADREKEAEQTLKMMFELGYVRSEEVQQIPRLAKEPKAIVYGPLGEVAATPDVVLVACKPLGAMLLQEAAGVGTAMRALGRPTCMALPAALEHGTLTSLGCIGNRVYTGLGEDEMYVVVRGSDLAAVAETLTTIENANAALEEYARGRQQQLSTT